MSRFFRCAAGVAVLLCAEMIAVATPSLTTIQDVIYRADGSRFNGSILITWPSFQASDGSSIAAHTVRVPVVNGFLHVLLVSTTDAQTPVSYSAIYNSDGRIQFVESWTVPPSTTPIRLSAVRMSTGGIMTPPGITAGFQIGDISGLSAALNVRPVIGSAYSGPRSAVIDSAGALQGAAGNASDCMHVDGTSAPCGSSSGASGTFSDGEVPAGTVDGVNTAFTLAAAPSPAASLALFRNGLLLTSGIDYSLTSNALTFASHSVPQAGDLLLASYRVSVALPGVGFVDSETPAGTVDGSNTTFALSHTPSPAASAALYRNGIRLKAGADYNISVASIVFTSVAIPQPGDVLVCSYRIAQ